MSLTIKARLEHHITNIKKLKQAIKNYQQLHELTFKLHCIKLQNNWDDVFKNKNRFKKFATTCKKKRIPLKNVCDLLENEQKRT